MQTENPIPKRSLGKTGVELSILGMGGIVVMNSEPAHAADIVAEAVDRGINYFDVAPSYGDAQEKLGPALEAHRDKVFLACKTGDRTKVGAQKELEESLRLLKTDHLDLYQLHAITDIEKDVKIALGPGGAMETILKAKEDGKIRFIGFSAHSPEAALAAMEAFPFDTILYPINIVCHYKSHFDQRPLNKARENGMGILALKAMASTKWEHSVGDVRRKDFSKCWYQPVVSSEDALRGLRFTLSQPGLTAALPPGEEKLFRMALDLVPQLTPMGVDELADAERSVQELQPIFP